MTRPPIFSDETLDRAIARATREERLVLLDMTASWCQPCQVMDRVTWPAPDVERWIADHAIALQVDVEAEHEIAKRFAVRAMPTVIALRDGAEIDRVSGLVQADALVAWLVALREGRTMIDTLRAALAEQPDDVGSHWRLARCLMERGDLPGATEELAWFWEHALELEPSFVGVRGSYALSMIRKLATRSNEARERFAALRDRAAESIERHDVAPRVLGDWVALSTALGDPAAVLAWVERTPDAVLAREELAHPLGGRVLQLLVEAERWHDIGRIHADPIAALRRELVKLDGLRDHPELSPAEREELPEIRGTIARLACERLALIERALRLGGRPDDADSLAREIAESPLAEAFAASCGDRSPGPAEG